MPALNPHHYPLSLFVLALLLGSPILRPLPAQAKALSTDQLVQQLRPRPKTAAEIDDELASSPVSATRGMVKPGADGSCDAPEVASGSGHRNLDVEDSTPPNTPRATLHLQFAFASYRLATADQRQLDALARALLHPDLLSAKYSITGHTDSSGPAAVNLKLSCGRSIEVRDYLLKRGVSASRLQAFGFGSARPLRPGNAADGANRRVEVRLMR